MTKDPNIENRPRLEPWPSQGVGPGPLSPFWRVEAPPEPPAPTTPAEIMARELGDFRRSCLAALRHAEDGVMPIFRSEIDWLNIRLSELKRLNADLPFSHRSSTIVDWPEPPLPTNILFGPRELIGPLGDAVRTLATIVEHEKRMAPHA